MFHNNTSSYSHTNFNTTNNNTQVSYYKQTSSYNHNATNQQINNINSKSSKYFHSSEQRLKYKRQIFKTKNILFENTQIQIGCKIQKLYDFYTSKNYIQINIFIGNKANKSIDKYQIQFKGTNNLNVYIQDKQQKYIKQKTQSKQRIILQLITHNDQQQQQKQLDNQIFLVMNFNCPMLTLNCIPIPLSLYNFLSFPSIQIQQKVIYPTLSSYQIIKIFQQKYQIIEQQQFQLNCMIFKKGYSDKQIQKNLQKMVKIKSNPQDNSQNVVFAGFFYMKKLVEQIGIIVEVKNIYNEEININIIKVKITLASNQYQYFMEIFQNFKYLLGK